MLPLLGYVIYVRHRIKCISAPTITAQLLGLCTHAAHTITSVVNTIEVHRAKYSQSIVAVAHSYRPFLPEVGGAHLHDRAQGPDYIQTWDAAAFGETPAISPQQHVDGNSHRDTSLLLSRVPIGRHKQYADRCI